MTSFDPARTATAQNAPFPFAAGREKGYQPAAVDVFLRRAKQSFESSDGQLDAATVRQASFPLVRGGYRIEQVDAALARVEDAFAQRERASVVASQGAGAWVEHARGEAQLILDHLARGPRRRFARTSFLSFGYRVDEVDHVAERIVRYLRDGQTMTAEQVRKTAFRMQRRGYREEQVDALLDSTIDVLLAVR